MSAFILKHQQSQNISFYIYNHLALNFITEQRDGRVLCQHCLFVHSIYIPPSIQPSPTSHSLIGDSMNERLDSLQHVSSLNYQHCDVSIVSLPRWQETKAEMCLHHKCVVLKKLQKSRHEKLIVYSVHSAGFMCEDHVHTRIQSLHWPNGSRWEVTVVLLL